MRTFYPSLFTALIALHGASALGREIGDPQPLSVAKASPHHPLVAQSNAAPAAAPATPQPGATLPAQRTETINYENWILTCRELLDGPKKRTCAATVAVQRSETGQTVLALTVQPNDQGHMTALIQTPTGVAIAPGVEVRFEKVGPRKFAYDFCDSTRCVASQAADGPFIRDISASAKLTVVIQAADGKPVNFEFPIKGFDKAYANMTKG